MNWQNRFRLAWRNLLRNRRRSLVTVLSLACGFTAVALFAGYTSSVYMALSNAAIHGELIGHLTINRTDWETQGKLHPDKYLLSADEIAKVRAIVDRRLPGSELVPKLGVSGLLSNGRTSTIFIATGIAPRGLNILRGPFSQAPGALHDDKPNGVTLAAGLADVLGVNVGDSTSVLATTIHGQANAADADIGDAVDTGNVATNDKLMLMPLVMAQNLADAQGRAESLTLLLPSDAGTLGGPVNIAALAAPDEDRTMALRAQLLADFAEAGLKLDVRTWQQMSTFYKQVKGMYDMIFQLMLIVVLAIVALSIANAMSMAVIERTREIGTLRAIGLRRSGIISLFVSEALVLVVVGIASSLALTALIRYGVNAADIRFVPPGNTNSVPVYIGFDMLRTAGAGVLLTVLAVIAALLPARRAAYQPVIEALGHV
ncbi:MAG: FtsX-like permease family protein [Pseudomonadota bacterium]